jgi:hypothetical protein
LRLGRFFIRRGGEQSQTSHQDQSGKKYAFHFSHDAFFLKCEHSGEVFRRPGNADNPHFLDPRCKPLTSASLHPPPGTNPKSRAPISRILSEKRGLPSAQPVSFISRSITRRSAPLILV